MDVREVPTVVQEEAGAPEAEVKISLDATEVTVRPGSDHKVRRTYPCLARALFHRRVLAERLPDKAVIPAADVEGGRVHVLVLALGAVAPAHVLHHDEVAGLGRLHGV